MESLCEELYKQNPNSPQSCQEIKQDLFNQMKQQIVVSYEAVKEKLKFTKFTFELVGYDFMIIRGIENCETG